MNYWSKRWKPTGRLDRWNWLNRPVVVSIDLRDVAFR